MEIVTNALTFDQYVFAMLVIISSAFCIGGAVGFALGLGVANRDRKHER